MESPLITQHCFSLLLELGTMHYGNRRIGSFEHVLGRQGWLGLIDVLFIRVLDVDWVLVSLWLE